VIDAARRALVHPLEILLCPQNLLQESVQGCAVPSVADHRERAVLTRVLDLQRSRFSDPGAPSAANRSGLLSWGRIARGFKRNVRQDGNVLSLTIPSYPPAGTLARYNNAGGCVAATHPARTISSFFRRARSPPPPAAPRARPRQWNSTSGSRRARGAVLLKIHSLPLPPTLPNPPPSRPGPAAEVASGNLHLIPGGPLCHQVAGSRATEKGGRLSLSLSLSCAFLPSSRRGTPAVSRRGTASRGRFAEQKKNLTPNYTRRLTK